MERSDIRGRCPGFRFRSIRATTSRHPTSAAYDKNPTLSPGAIVVTLDADFHAILAVSGASGPSVIRLRIEGLRAPELTTLIEKVVAEFQTDLQRGCLVTVKPHKTTCHRLPIGGD